MASDSPQPGDTVRLRYDAAGLPAGLEGDLIGWYAGENREALVRFGEIDTVRVPADAVERVLGGDERRLPSDGPGVPSSDRLPRYEVITIGDAEIGTTTIDADREYQEGDTIRVGRQTWVVDRVEPNVYGGLPRLICVRPTKG